jgi:hypothetical protein
MKRRRKFLAKEGPTPLFIAGVPPALLGEFCLL